MSFAAAIAGLKIEAEQPERMIVLGLDRRPLRNADGSLNYVRLYSADSAVARRHQRAVANRRIAQRGRSKPTAEEIEADAVEFLVALTAGWGALIEASEAEPEKEIPDPEFSAQAARALYADPAHAELRAQVDEFVGDRANFGKASSKS